MNHKQPFVSVIIPSHNHSSFITACIESVSKQNYTNFEVIVIDDGSEDNSVEVLENLQQKYNFKLICQKNKGLSFTLNRAIKEFAKGEYTTFCASDDYWLPEKLIKQVNFLEKNPEFPMVYGKTKIIDCNGDFNEYQTRSLNKGLKGGEIFEEIIFQVFHPPVNYMYRAEIFKEIGLFDIKAWAEDFDMNLRISAKYPIGFLDDFLSCYRRGTNSSSTNNPYRIVYSHRYSLEKFKGSPFYSAAIKRWHYRNFIWYASRKRSKLFAIKSMCYSIKFISEATFLKGIRDLLLRWY